MNYRDQIGLIPGQNSYRGNLHSHTVQSDGHLTPAESVQKYRQNGYSFLSLTEHDLYTDLRPQFEDESFLIFPGIEASSYLLDDPVHHTVLKCHHMNGILGSTEMLAAAEKRFSPGQHQHKDLHFHSWNGAGAAQNLCSGLQERGMLVTYNHPCWSRVDPEEFTETEGIWALEIFNYDTVLECGEGLDTCDWDRMLREGHKIFAVATDDNHNGELFEDSCGGWITVHADQLSHDAIIASLLLGNYYSSSGPSIEGFWIREGVVQIDCSPCRRINFITGGRIGSSRTILAGDQELTHAEYALPAGMRYVRAECVDASGRTAWTNPLYL